MSQIISTKRRSPWWRLVAAPIFWKLQLPNDDLSKTTMFDCYHQCMAEVKAQRQLAVDWLETIRRSNGLSSPLVLRPIRQPDAGTIEVAVLPAKEVADKLRRNIGSTLLSFCSDVLCPLEVAVRAGHMPRVSLKGGDSCRVYGRHAVYDLIDVRHRPLPTHEFELPEHVREIVRRIPPWLRPMVQFLEGTLVRTWIGGTQTTGGSVGPCRAIVFGRAVLAHWTENETANRHGCVSAVLGCATFFIAASLLAAGLVWVPSEAIEPLLEKLGDEFNKRGIEVAATGIVIALGLLLRKGWQLARRVSYLEKHCASDACPRA